MAWTVTLINATSEKTRVNLIDNRIRVTTNTYDSCKLITYNPFNLLFPVESLKDFAQPNTNNGALLFDQEYIYTGRANTAWTAPVKIGIFPTGHNYDQPDHRGDYRNWSAYDPGFFATAGGEFEYETERTMANKVIDYFDYAYKKVADILDVEAHWYETEVKRYETFGEASDEQQTPLQKSIWTTLLYISIDEASRLAAEKSDSYDYKRFLRDNGSRTMQKSTAFWHTGICRIVNDPTNILWATKCGNYAEVDATGEHAVWGVEITPAPPKFHKNFPDAIDITIDDNSSTRNFIVGDIDFYITPGNLNGEPVWDDKEQTFTNGVEDNKIYSVDKFNKVYTGNVMSWINIHSIDPHTGRVTGNICALTIDESDLTVFDYTVPLLFGIENGNGKVKKQVQLTITLNSQYLNQTDLPRPDDSVSSRFPTPPPSFQDNY